MIELLINFVVLFAYTQFPPDTMWTRTYGGEYSDGAYQVQPTIDSGFIVTGWTSLTPFDRDVYLIKTDDEGILQWIRTIGGGGHDIGRSVAQTSDKGYVIAGETSSYGAGSFDVYLIKFDSAGNLLWEKTFGRSFQDGARSIQELPDGGFIIAGLTDSLGFGAFKVYLLKTDAQGEIIWEKTYGGQGACWAEEVRQTNDGGYIIIGRNYSSGSGDIYLVKCDFNGDTLWTKIFGNNGEDYGFSVRQTPDNGYIICGCTSSLGAGGYDIYLIKTDSAGVRIWEKTFGGANDDYGYSVALANDGFLVSGASNSLGQGAFDIYLIKTDNSGNTLWYKTIGGIEDEISYSAQHTLDDGWIIAGTTRSFGSGTPGQPNLYLVKLGSEVVVTEVKREEKGVLLSLSPTLFRDKLTLKLTTTLRSPLQIVLYDAVGNKVYEKYNNPAPTIELTGRGISLLKSGIYFLSVYSNGKKIGMFKVIHLSAK
ncbi:MAG: hypothetical protein ACPL28_01730 [bacterium]